MRIIMDMSSYEIEYEPENTGYSDEVMCSGWTPAIGLMCQVSSESSCRKAAIPTELATIDSELFLQKMYTYQQ